jgi:predicted nuclease of predicted toxin-antitoxin system
VRIFVDENVPRGVVQALRDANHDVTWGCEFDVGMSDPKRVDWAFKDGRVILTEDNDFPALVFKQKMPVVGLVMIDLHGFKRDAKITRVVAAMQEIGEQAVGSLLVIGPTSIRRATLP